MSTLVSPGVAVPVVDESAYAAPGSGTIPLIILATRTNKTDPTGSYSDGIAPYTKPEFAGRLISVTSQREITQFFGTPVFRRSSNAIIEGAETSEYGLLAAYSYLGQGSQAYVVRANVDLADLEPKATAPSGPISNGTFWLDADDSQYGIHEWNGSRWVRITPLAVESPATDVAPVTVGTAGDYAVTVFESGSEILVRYWVHDGTNWERLDSTHTDTVTYSPHYSAPATPDTGDVWVKVTSPGGGVDLRLYRADLSGTFNFVKTEGVSDAPASTDFISQDGTSLTVLDSVTNGTASLFLNAATEGGFEIQFAQSGALVSIDDDFITAAEEPTGTTADGTIWFDSNVLSLDILRRVTTGWERPAADEVIYSVLLPSTRDDASALEAGDIWVDLSADPRKYPALHTYSGTEWIAHDNTDQTTDFGVLFADITDDASASGVVTPISTAPSHLLYPAGMLAVNMARSSNTVRRFDSSANAWRNHAPNHADGSGAFGRFAQRKIITTAMQAAVVGNEELREENKVFTIIAAPGYPELYDEMITLNSDRGETAFILVDTPFRLSPSQIPAWVDGQDAVENGEDGLINKYTYSGVFYPPARATTLEGDTAIVPASHIMLYQIGYSDNLSWPWFAAAGLTRGVVQNATNVGYLNKENEFTPISLSQGQRDVLYLNKVNPIANFAGEGVVVFGNKSLHPFSSALDRINVARLVAYIRERFYVIARPFLFEQNDQPTRDRFKNVLENFLFDIVSKRGIGDFAVQCDRTNNTNLRIDRNELWADVAIVPTKSTEFIYIPIRLKNTGDI